VHWLLVVTDGQDAKHKPVMTDVNVMRWEIKPTLSGHHLVLNFIQREWLQCVLRNKGKCKGVAVHATKAYRRSTGKAPLILYGAAWRR
jgi:hypothetical protein